MGCEVASGNAVIRSDLQIMEIEASDRSLLRWNSFCINEGEETRFILPSSDSIILNRVVGSEVSRINGNLVSNGHVWLVNPSGILVGKTGQINTNGLICASFGVLDEDFLSRDELKLEGDGGIFENLGVVRVREGDLLIAARSAVNEGVLEALQGRCELKAGARLLIHPHGETRISIEPLPGGKESELGVFQKGSLKARQVEIEADGNIYSLAIRIDGDLEALKWTKLSAQEGNISISGKVASGEELSVASKSILIEDSSKISSGRMEDGGKISLNSDRLILKEGGGIFAEPLKEGRGGRISMQANECTLFGTVSAQGARLEDDGGTVEIKALSFLDLQGSVRTRGDVRIFASDLWIGEKREKNSLLALDLNKWLQEGREVCLNAQNLSVGSAVFWSSPAHLFFSGRNISVFDSIESVSLGRVDLKAEQTILIESRFDKPAGIDCTMSELRIEGGHLQLLGCKHPVYLRSGAAVFSIDLWGGLELQAGWDRGSASIEAIQDANLLLNLGGDLLIASGESAEGFAAISTAHSAKGDLLLNIGGKTIVKGSAKGKSSAASVIAKNHLSMNSQGDIELDSGTGGSAFAKSVLGRISLTSNEGDVSIHGVNVTGIAVLSSSEEMVLSAKRNIAIHNAKVDLGSGLSQFQAGGAVKISDAEIIGRQGLSLSGFKVSIEGSDLTSLSLCLSGMENSIDKKSRLLASRSIEFSGRNYLISDSEIENVSGEIVCQLDGDLLLQNNGVVKTRGRFDFSGRDFILGEGTEIEANSGRVVVEKEIRMAPQSVFGTYDSLDVVCGSLYSKGGVLKSLNQTLSLEVKQSAHLLDRSGISAIGELIVSAQKEVFVENSQINSFEGPATIKAGQALGMINSQISSHRDFSAQLGGMKLEGSSIHQARGVMTLRVNGNAHLFAKSEVISVGPKIVFSSDHLMINQSRLGGANHLQLQTLHSVQMQNSSEIYAHSRIDLKAPSALRILSSFLRSPQIALEADLLSLNGGEISAGPYLGLFISTLERVGGGVIKSDYAEINSP